MEVNKSQKIKTTTTIGFRLAQSRNHMWFRIEPRPKSQCWFQILPRTKSQSGFGGCEPKSPLILVSIWPKTQKIFGWFMIWLWIIFPIRLITQTNVKSHITLSFFSRIQLMPRAFPSLLRNSSVKTLSPFVFPLKNIYYISSSSSKLNQEILVSFIINLHH